MVIQNGPFNLLNLIYNVYNIKLMNFNIKNELPL